MTPVPIEQLRLNIAETINRAAFGKERVVLSRHGKPVAVLMPMADLELLEALEDRDDLRAAKKARKEKGGVSLEALKRDLGL
jgi:prevent-host-death family protein